MGQVNFANFQPWGKGGGDKGLPYHTPMLDKICEVLAMMCSINKAIRP